MSRLMGKPTICIGENKGTDQLRSNCTAKLISAFVFATRIVQFLFYLNPRFQASSSFLCLCRSVCVTPVRKPHCWFSHEAAHISSWVMALLWPIRLNRGHRKLVVLAVLLGTTRCCASIYAFRL